MAQVPATSYESTSLGDVAEFTIPFPFLSRAEVFVTVDGAAVAFTWINDGLVQLTEVPELGAIVRRYRSTEAYVPLHQFSQGVPFLPRYVDRDFKQTLYAVQESVNDTAGTAAQALAIAEESLVLVQDAFDILGERTQYIDLGPYAAGLAFQTTSQVFSYLGEFYAPGPSVVLPYTTTGAGASEIANFRSVGDAVLRQDLASSSPGNGSALVAKGGQVVTSIAGLRSLLKTSASVNAFVTGYYAAGDGGGGEYYYDATDTMTADNGGTCIIATDGGRWKLVNKGTVYVRQFGAKGDGSTDDTSAFAGAVQSGCLDVVADAGTFMLSGLAIPAGVTLRGTSQRSSILKKRLNGTVASLGRHSKLLNLKIDGGSLAYATGNSVEISVGDNDPVYLNQGHQLIENCWFANSYGYHVAYTAANKGYQSKISRCIFDEPLGAGGLAAILWPDEPQNGGNRYVQTCYSSGPLVNLNGCDNGHITECIVGAGIKGGEQGILMPTGTVNSAKKAFIADNRFAVADLPMVFRGSSHVVTGNSFAATVTLTSAFTGSIFADNLTTKPIVDSLGDTSGTRVYHSQAVTPNFRSAGGGALIGNAVVSGLIEWEGSSKYYSGKFKFGSTTNFGAGQFITDLAGAISGSLGFSGDWQCFDLNTGVQWDGSIFCPSGGSNSMAFTDRGNTINATYPFAWASGDELHWRAKVR